MKIPRVCALHDMSGVGRCALTVVIPVLSATGAQVCPVPTALFSTHTGGFGDPASRDMTCLMDETLEHWNALGLPFDAVYSGFLGSAKQISVVERYICKFGGRGFTLVDPVLGDDGEIYKSITPELCQKMKRLAESADIITPNSTEAAILLGEKFTGFPQTKSGLIESVKHLGGKRSVIITGADLREGVLGCAVYDSTDGSATVIEGERLGGSFPGTGDIFASVLLGSLLRGNNLLDSAATAMEFVRSCVTVTLAAGTPAREGVLLEAVISELIAK